MTPLTLPLNDIVVKERQRKDYGDLSSLILSLQTYGLIQPIVVDQEKRLIAGGRRLAAATELGWKEVVVVYRETLTPEEKEVLELEENLHRKNLSWQEEYLATAKIHFLKFRSNPSDAEEWTQKRTAVMLQLSEFTVSRCLELAKLLKDPASPLWKMDGPYEAWKWIMLQEENQINAELHRRNEAVAAKAQEEKEAVVEVQRITAIVANPVELSEEEKRYYSNPHNAPGSFAAYMEERKRWVEQQSQVVYLSNQLANCDCLDFMEENEGRFDHIITDPPYAIDMEMLDQENVGMSNIDTVAAEHDVDENVALLKKFFPLAFSTLKEYGFLVLWCDSELRHFLSNEAIAAGFVVQRWPLTWVKSHQCMNNASQYNFTKSTEEALVCRKKGSVLAAHASVSHVVCGHDELKKELGGHPFIKPFAAWSFIIDHVSREGDLVLEPFAGAGSGVISLLRSKRKVVAVEKKAEHFNQLAENVRRFYVEKNPKTVFK